MKAKVFCKTVDKGVQAFYVKVDGKDYFLFRRCVQPTANLFFIYFLK